MNIDGKNYLTAADIVAKHGFSRPRLDQIVRRGKLKATRIGNRVLFDTQEVSRWERSRADYRENGPPRPPLKIKSVIVPPTIPVELWRDTGVSAQVLHEIEGEAYVDLSMLEITVRVHNALMRGLGRPNLRVSAVPISCIRAITLEQMLQIRGFGSQSAAELLGELARAGIEMREEN